MKNIFKKAISVLLITVMVLCSAPLSGFVGVELPEIGGLGKLADSVSDFFADLAPKAKAVTDSGTCGNNLTWTFDESTGELVISGTGNMINWDSIFEAPWNEYLLSIKTITISDSVTSIGSRAFYGCDSLTNVTIPDSVTSIGDYVFANCTSFASVTIGNGVTSIGYGAFYSCVSLTSVTIPDSVTSIGYYAFYSCDSLTSVTIGNSVTSIGDYAFYDCGSLTSITIPDSVTIIGNSAFAFCDSLASVTIGNGVTSIGSNVLYRCQRLTNITVDSANASLSSDEYGVLFSKDKTVLIQYPIGNTRASYTIPDSVTSIGEYAFEHCISLANIIIPHSVTAIGERAFYCCLNVEYIHFGANVTVIGENAILSDLDKADYIDGYYFTLNYVSEEKLAEYAEMGITKEVVATWKPTTLICSDSENSAAKTFAEENGNQFTVCNGHCEETPDAPENPELFTGVCGDNLTWTFDESTGELVISGTGEMYSWSRSSSAPWYSLRSLIKLVTIGNSVTSIGSYAFTCCSRFASVTIPDSVTSIGDSAFEECISLASVTIPDSVTSIGNYAFNYCNSLTSITVDSANTSYSNDKYGVLLNKNKTKLIQYPKGNTRTHYSIPDSVTSIGDSAFEDCASLVGVTIPDSVKIIHGSAFEHCTSLISVTIGNGATSIGDYAFNCCINLASVTIPDNVTSIGSEAFSSCSSLAGVTIGNGVTSIGSGAFKYCSSFSSVTIPDNVTSIGSEAFSSCDELISVTIGNGVTSIGEDAFSFCSTLTDVYYTGTQEEWNAISISDGNDSLKNANIVFELNSEPDDKEFTIEFNPNGGNFNGSEESITVCGVFGQAVAVPSEPIRNGYVFTGWDKDIPETFTESLTINATWDIFVENPKEPNIKSYSELDAQYDNFVYVGLDVIEVANGEFTDGYVQPGDWLEYRMTVLSDMYIGNTVPVFVYERDFFDVRVITNTTPSTSETYESYDYEGNIKFTDGSLMNPNHPVAPQSGAISSYTTLSAFPYSEVTTQLGYCEIDATEYGNWDFVKSYLGVTTTETNTNFEMKTDEWITSWYVRVKEGLAEGETGKSFSPESIWKHNINSSTGRGDTRRLADIYTADAEGTYASSRTMAHRYDVIEHVFLDDTYHTFTIGENPADNPAEPVPGTTKVTTYAELASKYEKFVYVGLEVIELADGQITDGYVQPGDWLEYRMTVLSDFYIGNTAPIFIYDRNFFDVRVITSTTPSTSATFNKADYEGNKKFTDGSFMNPDHPVAPQNGDISSFNTLTAFPYTNVATQLGFCEIDAETYSNWDFVKSNLGVTSSITNTNFEMKTDKWITSWYVRVKEGLANGTQGQSFSLNSIYKNQINPTTGFGDNRRLGDIYTADTLGTYASAKAMNIRYKDIRHLLLEDTYHSFIIGDATDSDSTEFRVTWNIDGTKTYEYYKKDEKIIVPDVPEKKGYSFVGWDTVIPETMPALNIVFNAVYEINTYSVDWCIDGLVMSDSYHYGDTIVKPKPFSKKGYKFVGWTPEIPATMPDYDLTFEAVWQVNTYTVFWDVDGVITEAEYDYNEPIIPLDSPEKEGHIFIGWGDEIPSAMPDYDLYFIAEWEVKKYNVTWITDGKETTAEYYYGEEIVVPELPEKRGYSIVGWNPEIPDKMPADNLSFEAEYIINTYVLTWNVDGVITEVEYDYNEPIILPDNPEKEGYTFIGWGAEIPSVMPDNDLYLTAEWELNKYGITWITDGEETVEEVFYGEEISVPELPEKTGYTFVGWTPEVPDTMPANDLVFNATWTANLYDAVFFTNGGSFSDGDSVKRIPTAYDSEIVSPGTVLRDGYIFSGWAYNGNNIGDDFGVMDTVEGKLFEALWIIDSSATYVVEYHMMNTFGGYDVTPMYFSAGVNQPVSVRPVAPAGFILNEEKSILEGTVTADNSLVLKVYIDRLSFNFNTVIDGVTETVSYYYGAMISEPAVPVKEGYEFVGWDKEIPVTMPAEDITVTAVFKEKTEEKTYAKLTIAKPEKSTIYYGESITLYASVKNAPEGAKIKWYVDGDGVSIKPSANGKTCKVTSTSNGNVVVRATLVDSKGNTIKGSDGKPVADYEPLYSEVTFWQIIVNFFRNLFKGSDSASQAFRIIF